MQATGGHLQCKSCATLYNIEPAVLFQSMTYHACPTYSGYS